MCLSGFEESMQVTAEMIRHAMRRWTTGVAVGTRTQMLVEQSGVFGVTILSEAQADLSDRFAGRTPGEEDRFTGLETFELVTGVPLLTSGLVSLDCRVVQNFPTETAIL